jgi:two-component system response regulator AtoC
MNQTLLVIDPQADLAREISAATRTESLNVLHVTSVAAAQAELRRLPVDLILCSNQMAGEEGFDIVPQLRRRRDGPEFALVVDGDLAKGARDAIARGVSEVIQRPICPGALQLLTQRVRDRNHAKRVNRLMTREFRNTVGEHPIIAASPSMIAVLEALERSQPGNAPKLIRGEPGSGRSGVARALYAQGVERPGPFVSLCCSAREEAELEAELFGSTSSRPGESGEGLLLEASGGTLYMEEVGDLSPRLQARLASVLEAQETLSTATGDTRELAVQIVVSTHRDLVREAKSGRYDEALINQLDPQPILVPPLRERREDIPLLADALVRHFSRRYGRRVLGISDAALEALTRYSWPGNLHELECTLEEATRLADGDKIDLPELPDALQQDPNSGTGKPWALRPARRRAESAAVRRALRSTGGNRTHAARILGISQRALLYKIKDYDIRD